MKKLIDFLVSKLDIKSDLLLEKDIILHRILLRLMKTSFMEEYAFKGGTCITKCYLGYYRFSEDLDFTYINQEEFSGMSQKNIRKSLTTKIDSILELLIKTAVDLDLEFKSDKSDAKYVQFGGSKKFVTFKLWYKSSILNKDEFVKIQINFFELITNKIIQKSANSLYSSINKEYIMLLFPQYIDILDDVRLKAYPLDEIIFEKVRAILTRRGIKSRDFIDVYMINKKIHMNLKKEEIKIINKIKFMLRYDKYLQNLSVIKLEDVILRDEEKLLLKPLDNGFNKFLQGFYEYLKELEEKIISGEGFEKRNA